MGLFGCQINPKASPINLWSNLTFSITEDRICQCITADHDSLTRQERTTKFRQRVNWTVCVIRPEVTKCVSNRVIDSLEQILSHRGDS